MFELFGYVKKDTIERVLGALDKARSEASRLKTSLEAEKNRGRAERLAFLIELDRAWANAGGYKHPQTNRYMRREDYYKTVFGVDNAGKRPLHEEEGRIRGQEKKR